MDNYINPPVILDNFAELLISDISSNGPMNLTLD